MATYAQACLLGLDSYDCVGCGGKTRRKASRCVRCAVVTAEARRPDPGRSLLSTVRGLSGPDKEGFDRVHAVVHRHSFYEHDCQTTECRALHLWRSREMTDLLTEAFERGRAAGPNASVGLP